MRKASRLFEIIQILRRSRQPVTAAQIGEELEVTSRSIYRDIAELQAMQVPVEGGRGIGYILRPGFTLPPLMFSVDEMEAIVLGLALLERTGDHGLKAAARRVSQKVTAVVPEPLRQTFDSRTIHAWGTAASSPQGIDLAVLRQTIRDEQKLRLDYCDEAGRVTKRVIWPIALIYYTATANVVAWCELRQSLRTFRVDRVQKSAPLNDFFAGNGDRLRAEWVAGWRDAQNVANP